LAGQASACLGDVAFAGRGSTFGAEREDDVRRAGGTHAGAHLGGIADVARAGAAGRAGVSGWVLAGATGAVALVERADVPVGATRRSRRRDDVGRTIGARARTRLRR